MNSHSETGSILASVISMRLSLKLLLTVASSLFVSQAVWSNDLAGSSPALGASSGGLVGDLTCAPERNYFQAELNNLAQAKNKTISSFLLRIKPLDNPIMDYRCVESSLAQVRAGGMSKKTGRFAGNDFNRCYVNGQGKLTLLDRQKEPCATTLYSKLTHHSYELVMNCLKGYVSGSNDPSIQNDWAETYFKFLTKESGLHVNVVSSTDAVGIGQLTTGYIVHFVDKSLDNVRTHLRKSSKPWCRTLGAEMLSDERIAKINYTQYLDPKTGEWESRNFNSTKQAQEAATKSKCEMINMLEGEPLTNMIISFSHLKVYRDQIASILHERERIFKKLNAKDKAYLLHQLTTLSYNTGVGGLSSALKAVMKEYSANEPVLHVDSFLKVLSRALAPRGDRDDDRAIEMAQYLNRINKRYDEVTKRAGVQDCRIAK